MGVGLLWTNPVWGGLVWGADFRSSKSLVRNERIGRPMTFMGVSVNGGTLRWMV